MTVGPIEIGALILGIAALLWLLPKTLPQLGRAVREFQEEIRQR